MGRLNTTMSSHVDVHIYRNHYPVHTVITDRPIHIAIPLAARLIGRKCIKFVVLVPMKEKGMSEHLYELSRIVTTMSDLLRELATETGKRRLVEDCLEVQRELHDLSMKIAADIAKEKGNRE